MELTNKNIGAVADDIRAFFEKSKVPRKDLIKICLIVEEHCSVIKKNSARLTNLKFIKKKWFSAPKIIIQIKGEPFNPLKNDSDNDTIFSNETMQKLLNFDEAKTIYRYKNGCNELIFYSTKEQKPLKISGGSITIAIIFSFIVGYFPQEIQSIFIEKIVTPLLSTLMGLIITVTIFFSAENNSANNGSILRNVGYGRRFFRF